MEIPDPRLTNLPGEFGDVDMRDTHPIPGQEKRPPQYADIGEGLFDGGQPVLGEGIEAGVGGGLPGDVRSESDGYNVHAPDGDVLHEESMDAADVERTEDENPA